MKVALSICSLGVISDTVGRIRKKHGKESQKSAERGFARSAISACIGISIPPGQGTRPTKNAVGPVPPPGDVTVALLQGLI